MDAQFDKLMFILQKELFSQIPEVVPAYNTLPDNSFGYTQLPRFAS